MSFSSKKSQKKKFFWLKLKDDFFGGPKIKKLRKIAGGDTYTIILQKIMLLSIKDEGVIEFQGIEKTLHDELALILDEDASNVEICLSFMRSIGLVEQLNDNEFLLPYVPELIGSEGDSAERVRLLRARRKEAKEYPVLQCNSDVTPCNTEKELESDLDRGEYAREAYLEFRMSGEGIHSPKAFKKTLKKDLHNPESDEYKDLLEWQELSNGWPKVLSNLYDDFCNFGHKNRKKCKEIATDHVYEYGVNITPMIFEIAFYESCKTIRHKGAA